MKKVLIVAMLLCASDLYAGFYPKNMFMEDFEKHKKCELSESNCDWSANFRFQLYITGITDALIDAKIICPGANVTGRQIVAVTTKYIENNPEKWSQSTSYLVELPLLNTFPCKNESP